MTSLHILQIFKHIKEHCGQLYQINSTTWGVNKIPETHILNKIYSRLSIFINKLQLEFSTKKTPGPDCFAGEFCQVF